MAHDDTLIVEMMSLLADSNNAACIALFMDLLRESSGLRRWLNTAFLDAKTRARLARYLVGNEHPPRHGSRGQKLLAWLSDTGHALDAEAKSLTPCFASIAPSSYGGLTRPQIVQLIRRYQSGGAGNIKLPAFLLAHAWKQMAPRSMPSAALLAISGRFLHAAFVENGKRRELLGHFMKASEFLWGRPHGAITRADYGYANWWKLSVLHYMLNHPKASYCTRDFIRLLAAQKIRVDTKDVRRFCKKHCIAQDPRPGRPKS